MNLYIFVILTWFRARYNTIHDLLNAIVIRYVFRLQNIRLQNMQIKVKEDVPKAVEGDI